MSNIFEAVKGTIGKTDGRRPLIQLYWLGRVDVQSLGRGFRYEYFLMNSQYFMLTTNAFHILKADYVSSRSDIADLVDDAEFDEVFAPEQIQRAQHSLLAPIARLEQEISWLPELSEGQISNILSVIMSGELETLIETSKHTPELAKANILAHFCETGNVNDSLFHALVAAWDEIDKANILIFINKNREIAGFPSVEMHHLREALKGLEKLHARTAAFGIWTLDQPGEVMDRIVEAELQRHSSSSFLEQFVRSYDNLSEPELIRVSDHIDRCIELAGKYETDLSVLVGTISDLLIKWDDINQPVQVYEQHQGHEEGRSKKIYEKLRSLCLDLANNRSEFSEARRLSEALLRTFPELESVAEILKGDVAVLETLDDQQKLHIEFGSLIEACEAAKTKLPTPVSSVLTAFKTTSSRVSDNSIAFTIVRDLALHINNDCNDPETAFKLIDGLLNYNGTRPTQELGRKMQEERAVLHRNWKMNELDKNAGNLAAMSKTLDDLLKYASGPERTELQQLKTKIERKHLGNKLKWGVYTAISIVAVIGFIVIVDELDRPSSRSSYQASTPKTATPAPAKAPTVAAVTLPPIGQGLTLNRSQVRYCVFQGQKLETIRTLTNTNNQIDRFNGLIADFNARCSNYRYTSGILSSVHREARDKAAELRADAMKIVSSW